MYFKNSWVVTTLCVLPYILKKSPNRLTLFRGLPAIRRVYDMLFWFKVDALTRFPYVHSLYLHSLCECRYNCPAITYSISKDSYLFNQPYSSCHLGFNPNFSQACFVFIKGQVSGAFHRTTKARAITCPSITSTL